MENVRYVIREILEPLKYLEERNIMHGDIKSMHASQCYTHTHTHTHMLGIHTCALSYPVTNILVLCNCDCPSVFLCQCSHDKPSIKLGDFDSAKKVKTASPESYHFYGNFPVTRKVPEECARVLGTPGYRSPEVSYTAYCVKQRLTEFLDYSNF